MKRLFFILFIMLYSHITHAQLPVYVSILPQKYFVERIGGEHVDVSVMVQAGHSPATYEPTPQQMVKLAQTELYIRIGVPFENVWLPKLQQNNPQLTVVDARQNIELQAMPDIEKLFTEHDHHEHEEDHHDDHEHHKSHDEHEEDHHHESHNEHEEDHHDEHEHHEAHHHHHEHGEFDPHIWLSPHLVKVMAEQILQQLTKYDAEHRADYQKNYAQFIAELEQLDSEITKTLSVIENRKFMVFHPAWSYFAQAYQLHQVPIEIEGKAPNSKDFTVLINYAKQQQIKVVFVQKQFSQKAAQTIANAIPAQLIVVDPLAENYIENLANIAKTFAKVME